MGLLSANWRDWYRFRHSEECFQSGTAFEEYITKVLSRFHDDFINPVPTGRLGDGGCDGIAEAGTIAYACYGQRPGRDAERELAKKVREDFDRARSVWATFHTWRFVTNAPFGPKASAVMVDLQQAHHAHPLRPVKIRHFGTDKLWTEVVSKLDADVLDELFPGVPGAANVELRDLIPLLDKLGTAGPNPLTSGTIRPVPPHKMEFNELPERSRLEFNSGRLLAPQIDEWYAGASDPALYDTHGDRFRALYQQARAVTDQPAEILERLYVAVAGSDPRMDAKRANAAYAVVSYFFDSCHIFEEPPGSVSVSGEEVHHAASY
ncbi:ABC-three component system protein [Nocardia sp. MW-W600-9]